jgi:hypothetical protein
LADCLASGVAGACVLVAQGGLGGCHSGVPWGEHVRGAVVAYFFLNWWNLKVSPNKSVRHIPWCVCYHVQGFQLEALQDLDVWCGSRAPELDTISPDRFEDAFYRNSLLLKESCDFRPSDQYVLVRVTPICFPLMKIWSLQGSCTLFIWTEGHAVNVSECSKGSNDSGSPAVFCAFLRLGGGRTFQNVQSPTSCSLTTCFVAFVSIGFLMIQSEVLSFVDCSCFLATRLSLPMLNSGCILLCGILLAELSQPSLLSIFSLHTAGTAGRRSAPYGTRNFLGSVSLGCGGDVHLFADPSIGHPTTLQYPNWLLQYGVLAAPLQSLLLLYLLVQL